jgi:uncharacterized protein (DUF302 family)
MTTSGPGSAHLTSRSRYSFDETVRRLTENVSKAGATLFATIDQADAARRVGLHLRPTTLLLFGNPRGGTPLMDAEPMIALYLPLRILVWGDETVYVSRISMTKVAEALELSAAPSSMVALDKLVELVVTDVISVP